MLDTVVFAWPKLGLMIRGPLTSLINGHGFMVMSLDHLRITVFRITTFSLLERLSSLVQDQGNKGRKLTYIYRFFKEDIQCVIN